MTKLVAFDLGSLKRLQPGSWLGLQSSGDPVGAGRLASMVTLQVAVGWRPQVHPTWTSVGLYKCPDEAAGCSCNR